MNEFFIPGNRVGLKLGPLINSKHDLLVFLGGLNVLFSVPMWYTAVTLTLLAFPWGVPFGDDYSWRKKKLASS